MGLRTHTIGPIKQDPSPQDGCTLGKIAFKEETDSQGNDTQQDLASQAHCSANSLHAQGHLQGVTARSDTVNKPACKMHEVTADSEEVKRSSSREPDGGSPQSSNPASLGQQRMSSTQRQQSGDFQTGSGGECKTMTCYPIHLSACNIDNHSFCEDDQQDLLLGLVTCKDTWLRSRTSLLRWLAATSQHCLHHRSQHV